MVEFLLTFLRWSVLRHAFSYVLPMWIEFFVLFFASVLFYFFVKSYHSAQPPNPKPFSLRVDADAHIGKILLIGNRLALFGIIITPA